jgi:hypothetical protein
LGSRVAALALSEGCGSGVALAAPLFSEVGAVLGEGVSGVAVNAPRVGFVPAARSVLRAATVRAAAVLIASCGLTTCGCGVGRLQAARAINRPIIKMASVIFGFIHAPCS